MRINNKLWAMMLIGLFSLTVLVPPAFAEASTEAAISGHAWWFWPIVLFIVTFIMGILAVLGGVGGLTRDVFGTPHTSLSEPRQYGMEIKVKF